MTVAILPLTLLETLERRLQTAATAVPSIFTGQRSVQDWGGAWWEYSFEFARTQGRDGRALSAFFTALGGVTGSFLLADPSAAGQAATPGLPGVNGAGQSGTSLATSGWIPGGPGLAAGDLFSLGSGEATRLHQLTADVIPDALGEAALHFVPALRAAPADLEPLNVTAPQVCLQLTSPVPTRMARVDTFRFSVTAVEVL